MAGNLNFLSKFPRNCVEKALFPSKSPCFRSKGLKWISYIQGQTPEPNRREYFYYIDHNGMLFLDDSRMKNFTSCFKEKKFLVFFFQRLRKNETGRYEDDFPFVSPCGRERNYIRCDDVPIVYTHTVSTLEGEFFCHNHAGDDLKYPFNPSQIYMSITTGRIYHPTSDQYQQVGLIQSKTAIELSKLFQFRNGEDREPTHILWKGVEVELDPSYMKGIHVSTEFPSEQI
uniref:UPF0598 protein C8orf82 homolog n=1 Tax=Cacopsylla melanoneura TaxID=428564 RepID=A0A8D8LUA6_9HEMI